MDWVCAKHFVGRLRCMGGEVSLELEDGIAWQAARKQLQMHSSVSSETLTVMDELENEMGSIKLAICHVHCALAVLSQFERDISRPASNTASGQIPHLAREACQSAEEYKSESSRSTAAASGLGLQDEAEHAATQRKQAKNSKKKQARKSLCEPSCRPAPEPEPAGGLSAGQYTLYVRLIVCFLASQCWLLVY